MLLFTANGEAMSHLSVKSTYITNIGTTDDWSEFCAAVNGGYDYSGVEVRLTDDITEVSDMVGTSFDCCFKGIYIYNIPQKYVIVLEPQVRSGNAYYLLTAYYLDEDYGEKQMKKKMKKRLQDVL